jgi:lactobin A/cerein 7B family class IIb bacteriocin
MINKEELKKIQGGGFNIGVGILIGGIVTFLIGLVDGYVRPLACR